MTPDGAHESADVHGTRAPLEPWVTVNRTTLLERQPWVQVEQEAVRLPDGRVIDDFYRVVLPTFVLIVATTRDGRMVCLRSYKHGARRVTRSVPAGMVEHAEQPLAAAQRELYEETGYASNYWRSLGSYFVDGNRQCGTAHVFLATDAVQDGPGGEGDDLEDVRVELIDTDTFLKNALEGEMVLLPTIAAIGLALEALRVPPKC